MQDPNGLFARRLPIAPSASKKALDILGFCRRRFDLLAIKRLALQSCWVFSLVNALQLCVLYPSSTVSVIDTASNTVVATVPVGTFPLGVAVHPGGSTVYVANLSSNTVLVIDTTNNTVVATVTVGDGPVAFGQFIGPFSLTIFPASGSLAPTFGFDLGFIVDAPGLSVTGGTATLDAVDISASLKSCIIPGTLISCGQTFRCPNLSGAFLGEGTHTLSVTLNLSSASSVSRTVTWKVLGNTEP